MSETTYTHKDLAEMLGVSETTVKSYRRKFPGCIPVVNHGKPIRFSLEAAPVTTRIRDLFDTGMSVKDVRQRLASEFDWIHAAPPAPEDAGKARPKGDVGPELSHGVSNMAKSLVSMTQQQNAIISRIRNLEALLEGTRADGAEPAPARDKAAYEALIESRLDRLDKNTSALSATVRDLAEQLSRFLGQRSKAAEAWPDKSSATLAAAADIAARIGAAPAEAPVGESATVIPLRPAVKNAASRQPGTPSTEASPSNASAEPPRLFFTLPLVVRTEQGYISAGGKSRGRFSLNDLKAMLIYGFTPPAHFTLRWERHGQGWWLYLEQEQGGRAVHMLLMEVPSQKGGNVAEILQIKRNGETLHPVEVCAIVDSFGA
ncbi:MAG: helix-turn-helix domain-containing protein [Desulfovibrio sp.]|jgi:DNA-binding transcriptional MerR regulator|nr:helix-turn-helix domain-containing protein [Desulfovibrio sp.]